MMNDHYINCLLKAILISAQIEKDRIEERIKKIQYAIELLDEGQERIIPFTTQNDLTYLSDKRNDKAKKRADIFCQFLKKQGGKGSSVEFCKLLHELGDPVRYATFYQFLKTNLEKFNIKKEEEKEIFTIK